MKLINFGFISHVLFTSYLYISELGVEPSLKRIYKNEKSADIRGRIWTYRGNMSKFEFKTYKVDNEVSMLTR